MEFLGGLNTATVPNIARPVFNLSLPPLLSGVRGLQGTELLPLLCSNKEVRNSLQLLSFQMSSGSSVTSLLVSPTSHSTQRQ